MADALDSTRTPSRRAFFAHAVASGVAAAQPPIFLVAGASGLALACTRAATQRALLDSPEVQNWTDERWDRLYDDTFGIYERAITEGSASIGDVVAKARLLLGDLERSGELEKGSQVGRLASVILNEIVSLAA
ncbi:hypothetical protein Q8W71_17840 [Methylobacterium sp. NEAU 140]|uniref:hypothetical protein n=1 Tax=Methylobacterium sp. NEAU 140 TaxID=3064945 RepID=UPI002736CAA9|nr:hypothetical protein [Methylobacterium sp. NEAU 140]MDP4024489.1 hypothetical protein [Methylobacterium sp. NEAU 140]